MGHTYEVATCSSAFGFLVASRATGSTNSCCSDRMIVVDQKGLEVRHSGLFRSGTEINLFSWTFFPAFIEIDHFSAHRRS